jgi:hypothetical protein
MKIVRALSVFLVATGGLVLALGSPVQAGAPQQQIITSTPEPNGNRYHVVAPGENCSVIESAYYGSPDPAHRLLFQLNADLDKDCAITAGQQLLMGVGVSSAASATPEAARSTPTPIVTATPFTGTTEICVLLFDDLNGDALRQELEPVVLGGAISVAETSGKYSETREPVLNPDPEAYAGICFTDVPEGQYNIGAAIPDNYNPTMNLTYTMEVQAGDRAFVDFGAQSREPSSAQGGTGEAEGTTTSPLMGIAGGFLLLAGLGLAWYAVRLRNPRGRMRLGGLQRR